MSDGAVRTTYHGEERRQTGQNEGANGQHEKIPRPEERGADVILAVRLGK